MKRASCSQKVQVVKGNCICAKGITFANISNVLNKMEYTKTYNYNTHLCKKKKKNFKKAHNDHEKNKRIICIGPELSTSIARKSGDNPF